MILRTTATRHILNAAWHDLGLAARIVCFDDQPAVVRDLRHTSGTAHLHQGETITRCWRRPRLSAAWKQHADSDPHRRRTCLVDWGVTTVDTAHDGNRALRYANKPPSQPARMSGG